MDKRKSKVQSWYLDMSMIRNYWGADRAYHHTAPVNMNYALREALAIIVEEGLDARIERHQKNHLAMRAGLESLGLSYIPHQTLATLNAVNVPDGIDDTAVRKRLLDEFGIEIGAGLGPFKGKAWRIGLMGSSSCKRHVVLLLAALETILAEQGWTEGRGAVEAAEATYQDGLTAAM